MLVNYFLRRHQYTPDKEEYWYEIMANVREFPHAVPQERQVCVVHSQATGRLMVDELNRQRREGVIEGLTRFAWWQDGRQMVGTCGTTLEQAVKDIDNDPWF